MPQMAPIWWTFIMLMTIFMMVIMIMINYFNSIKLIKLNFKSQKKELNWKW